MQNDTRSCLNTNKRDCKVEKGLSFQNSSGDNVLIFNSDTGQSEKSVCVPKYTPGFNFWDPNAAILGIIPALTPSQICSFASSAVLGGYHASLVGGIWEAIEEKCFKNCVDTYKDWIVGKATAQEACFNKCPHSEVFANDGAGAGELKDVSLNQTWVIGRESLSSLLGDCGVKANYIGEPGYSKWGDLFIGDNITLTSIPGYSSYK